MRYPALSDRASEHSHWATASSLPALELCYRRASTARHGGAAARQPRASRPLWGGRAKSSRRLWVPPQPPPRSGGPRTAKPSAALSRRTRPPSELAATQTRARAMASRAASLLEELRAHSAAPQSRRSRGSRYAQALPTRTTHARAPVQLWCATRAADTPRRAVADERDRAHLLHPHTQILYQIQHTRPPSVWQALVTIGQKEGFRGYFRGAGGGRTRRRRGGKGARCEGLGREP